MAKPQEGEPRKRLQRERPLPSSPLIFDSDIPTLPLTPEERARTRQVLDLMRIQLPDVVAYKDPRTGLGTRDEVVEGNEYFGRLRGRAWLTSDYDDGSLLSNITSDEYYRRMRGVGGGSDRLIERANLAMAELFPESWDNSEMEYEILVRARRIAHANDPRLLEAQLLPQERLLKAIFGQGPSNEELRAKMSPEYQRELDREEQESAERAQGIFREVIEETLTSLNERERRVINLRFGLIDGRQRTQREAAQAIERSKSTVGRVEASALKKLREVIGQRSVEEFNEELLNRRIIEETREIIAEGGPLIPWEEPEKAEKQPKREVRMLTAELLTEELGSFEKKYGMSSEEFYTKYRASELEDSADYSHWAGLYYIGERQKRKGTDGGEPTQLTDEDKAFLERRIGVWVDVQGNDYYVRLDDPKDPGGTKLSYLLPEMVGKSEDEAIKALLESWELTEPQATAAWLFLQAFPKTVHTTFFRLHGRWLDETILGEEPPERSLKIE